MKVIYIAGPYSAPTREGVEANRCMPIFMGLDELSRWLELTKGSAA